MRLPASRNAHGRLGLCPKLLPNKGTEAMLTVKSARIPQGYSHLDHYITGRECQAVVGRRFRSLQSAAKAADKEARKHDEGHYSGWVSLEVLIDGDTETQWHTV
jgi:hypothetical protein